MRHRTNWKEHKHDKRDMFIADLYLPQKLIRHRIVRGGGTPPQLQFLTQWQDGWTSDISLAKNVIRKHPTEDLWLVAYKDSWEPLSNDVITYAMITLYKEEHKIQQFGFGFDELLKKISIQNRPPIRTETIHPSNIFHYVEVEQDLDELEPPMRRKRGRPKTGKQKEKRIPQQHQKDRPLNCECGKDCIEAFDGNLRKKIKCEFDELPNLSSKSTWLTTHVELNLCKLKGTALQVRRRSRHNTLLFF